MVKTVKQTHYLTIINALTDYDSDHFESFEIQEDAIMSLEKKGFMSPIPVEEDIIYHNKETKQYAMIKKIKYTPY